MLKNQHLSFNFSLFLSDWTVLITHSLGKEIGGDLGNTTFQKGDPFLQWVFSLGKSLEKNYSQHQPQLPHKASTSWQQPPIRNLIVFIISPSLWGCPLCEMEQREGLPELITPAGGWAQVCSCSTFVPAPWETQQAEFGPMESHRSGMLWYQDCRLIVLPRHNKKELFHGGGIWGAHVWSSWWATLFLHLPRLAGLWNAHKNTPHFLPLLQGQQKTLISSHAIKTNGCHM